MVFSFILMIQKIWERLKILCQEWVALWNILLCKCACNFFLRGCFEGWLYNIVCGKVKERHQKIILMNEKAWKRLKSFFQKQVVLLDSLLLCNRRCNSVLKWKSSVILHEGALSVDLGTAICVKIKERHLTYLIGI